MRLGPAALGAVAVMLTLGLALEYHPQLLARVGARQCGAEAWKVSSLGMKKSDMLSECEWRSRSFKLCGETMVRCERGTVVFVVCVMSE